MSPSPRVAVLPPEIRPWAADAVKAGGGEVVAPGDAEALVWTVTGFEPGYRPEDLSDLVAANPRIGWVQLPFAGVEPYAAAGVFDRDHVWTSGKGVYARPVAEHALVLALAGFHNLKPYCLARTWTEQAGANLGDGRVTIFGGGGITEALVALLQAFRCRITVVRRHPGPMAGVDTVVAWADREATLPEADAVILALALTSETEGCIAHPQLNAMAGHAWLVNVARGGHVVTDDLVAALKGGSIGGAALDVTDPEPLPDGHPLWDLPNCIITPHTANTYEMAVPLLAARITDNVRRYRDGEDLLGRVDPALGY